MRPENLHGGDNTAATKGRSNAIECFVWLWLIVHFIACLIIRDADAGTNASKNRLCIFCRSTDRWVGSRDLENIDALAILLNVALRSNDCEYEAEVSPDINFIGLIWSRYIWCSELIWHKCVSFIFIFYKPKSNVGTSSPSPLPGAATNVDSTLMPDWHYFHCSVFNIGALKRPRSCKPNWLSKAITTKLGKKRENEKPCEKRRSDL